MVMVEGGLLPFLAYLWRMDADWRACRSEVPHCRRPPSEYVWEHVRFTTQPFESPPEGEELWPLIRHLRPEQTMLFASDYPHWDFDEPTHVLRLLPADVRDAVAYRNAADVFQLTVPVGA
jgi:predicted TIM-barrel fold metal-dependent hydrolase